jgi:hypothetical protein
MEQNYEKRVTLSYLTTKIRQNDSGNVGIEEVHGINMLAIRESFEIMEGWSLDFVTYIYYDEANNCIREIFLDASDGMEIDSVFRALADGEEIITSHGFEFYVSGSYVEIELTDEEGITHTSRVTLRASAG